jgi:hypothetical protein
MEMEQESFELFWKAINPIESAEILKTFVTSDYPHLKKERRQSIHKDLHKSAFKLYQDLDSGSFVETKALAELLAGKRNG